VIPPATAALDSDSMSFVGKAWLPEMNLVIDSTWHQIVLSASMITHSDDLALMLSEISTIKSFSIKTSQKITPSFTILAFLIKTLFILYYKLLTNFLISYPKKQLQQLLNYSFLILLCSICKIIGTSTILNFLQKVLYFISI
jgi:hypothetical protein